MADGRRRPDGGGGQGPRPSAAGRAGGPAGDPADATPAGRRARALDAARGTAGGLARVAALVWEASPPLTLALAAATVLAGVIPAAQAYTTKLLIDAVVRAIAIHAAQGPDRLSLAVPLLWGALRTPLLSSTGLVVLLAAGQFLLLALSSLLQTGANISQQLLQERVSMRVQLLIMEQAARLDLAYFEDARSYDTLQQAQREATYRPLAMVQGSFGLVRTLLTFLSMIGLLLGINPWLALVSLVAPIPSFISSTRFGWQGYGMQRRNSPVRRRMAYLLQLVTTDTYAKEVKLFTLGQYFIDSFRTLALGYYAEQRRLVTRRYLIGYAWGALSTLAGTATYLYVALLAIAGRITLGDISLYTQAASAVQGAFQGLLGGVGGLYENNLYLTALYDLLRVQPRLRAPERPAPAPLPLRGAVEFRHVEFHYEHSERNALRDVSFRIEPGETVAIVGRNGAGKTTLIKLLCRLYDPDGGSVLIDGRDARDYDPDELRAGIATPFQDYVTYQATARENIGLGRLERLADRAAIAEAAERSGAAEVIARLPDGYESMLGKWFEGGVNLSGGEWQKVALARAFVRDAGILILDEPTAALDAQAEFELFRRLRDLAAGRTAVFISHRFSTVRLADRILVLEDGALVEQGSHEELLALDGRYAHLFSLQAAAYVGDPAGAEAGRAEGRR